MSFDSLTEERISAFITCPKRVINPQVRSKYKEGHEQVNYRVVATDESGFEFEIYKRQNMREGMEDDFSCGISWISPSGESLTLRRYNGPSHDHKNHLEREYLGKFCHIHQATERYIKANKKAEGYAEVSTKYRSLDGALHLLVKDLNVSGISTRPDNPSQTTLFE